jgi:hypothetical protein
MSSVILQNVIILNVVAPYWHRAKFRFFPAAAAVLILLTKTPLSNFMKKNYSKNGKNVFDNLLEGRYQKILIFGGTVVE